MKKKIIDKLKSLKLKNSKSFILKNKKKLEIISLVVLIAIAIVIFSFGPLGKNVSNFVVEKICSKTEIQDGNAGANDIEEEEFVSDNYTKKDPDLTIGVMADSHVEGSKYWIINEFAKKMQIAKPDFVIEVGDFIQNRNRKGKGMVQQPIEEGIADWKKADANLLGYMPRYHVIGNHEMFSLHKKDYENLIGSKSYYSFIVKNYQIIVLDAMYWSSTNEDVERGREKPGAYIGFIPQEEKKWLEEKLGESDRNIIFVHHPLYNILNSLDIEKLLTRYNDRIVLILSGHKHDSKSFTFAGIDYIDIPSLELQKQYLLVNVKGKKSEVEFLNLQ